MSQADQPSIGQVLRGYVLLPHAVPIIVVITATAAFALVAAGGWPGTGAMVLLLGAMLGGQVAIGAINELVDVDLDRTARPDKPIPAGLVTERGAWTMTATGLAVMVLLSATFGVISLLLCTLGTLTGIAYSLWFKRTVLSWLPYLVAIPLLPIWVWAALDDIDLALFSVYPLGAGAVIALQIAQSLPDVASDRAAGVNTLAVALGERRALWACWGSMATIALAATIAAPWLGDNPALLRLAALAVLALVALNIALWRREARTGVMATFPCTAVATVALGIGWAIAVVGS